MALPKKVERRSDGQIFKSAGAAGKSVGRRGERIMKVCQDTAEGIFAQAYGHQWRYWRPGNMPAWPEKGATRHKLTRISMKAATCRAAKAVTCATCPAGFAGGCPHLELTRQLAGLIVRSLTPEDLEALKNERQTDRTDRTDPPAA